ncbi:MAG: DNA methyltransferase, partial [Roseovarius sp.]|nr:DNA methyltransferase [Roseovarius sp.]
VRIRHFLPTDIHGNFGRKKQLHDVWSDIVSIGHAGGKEKMGYKTQKPVALLERIIYASCPENGMVLDPFCGCATTIEAAHRLGRQWIGIDVAIHAIKRVAGVRLRDRLGLVEGVDFIIDGVPRNLEGARDLWERNKYHFQKWAVEQVDGFVTSKKGSDGGIDGRIYFDQQGMKDLQSMVIEVKGGTNVGIGVVRDLRGVLERETAQMAGLIVMDDLGERKTRNFAREMASAGDLNVMGMTYPRMQMLTVREIFDGRRFLTPSVARGKGEAQPKLPFSTSFGGISP